MLRLSGLNASDVRVSCSTRDLTALSLLGGRLFTCRVCRSVVKQDSRCRCRCRLQLSLFVVAECACVTTAADRRHRRRRRGARRVDLMIR